MPPHHVPQGFAEALQLYQTKVLSSIQSGQYEPFVYPYNAIGGYLLFAYLLLPPSRSKFVYRLRYLVVIVIAFLAFDAILHCRSPMVTGAYGIGLINAWMILWTATLLLFNDARSDFRRIEQTQATKQIQDGQVDSSDHDPDSARSSGYTISDEAKRRGRLQNDKDVAVINDSDQSLSKPAQVSYRWQGLPSIFIHRFDWATDLFNSFRGPRWNFAVSGLTPPPRAVQRSFPASTFSEPTPFSDVTRKGLLRQFGVRIFLCIIASDILKAITSLDPYFWSLGPESPSPFPWPKYTRLFISATLALVSLEQIFSLSPLVFACLLGPRVIGSHAWPWLYTPFFGSFRHISRKGLAGAWGQWWQQVFRFGFEQSGEATARVFGIGQEKRTARALFIKVGLAFAASGYLHACASYTSINDTKPISGSFAFFMVQPVGIIIQRSASQLMRKVGIRDKIPELLREIGNTLFVIFWFGLTGSLVADDFAATGIWLYEPLPISLTRGLMGQGWWRWGGTWVRWHTGRVWWKSGLAF